MSHIFHFSPAETELIARMYKERLPSRQIAKILGKSPVEVSNYIRTVLVKRAKPPTIIGRSAIEAVKLNRVTGGLRHYNDPLAAKEGSRMLLEALVAYFRKREGQTA